MSGMSVSTGSAAGLEGYRGQRGMGNVNGKELEQELQLVM